MAMTEKGRDTNAARACVCSIVSWLPSSVPAKSHEAVGGAQYHAASGGNVTVYVDTGKNQAGPTLGSSTAGYCRV